MKKYGLQIRAPSQKKQPTTVRPRPSIFDEDEDVDVEKEISRQASKTKSHKETEEQLKKALEEDPSAFAYDEVIDDIKQKAIVPKLQDRQDRKPRYVQHLMKKAEQRQKEHEIVYERKLAKEREKDDDLFSGKEKFITGAYKRKLEEQKKWLAEERLRELREERDDVTKKKDLSDFYFNMVNNVALGARGIEEKEEQRKAEKMEEEMRKEEKKAESPEKEVLLPESQDVGSSRKRKEEKDSSSKEEAKEAPKATTTTQHKKSEDAIAAARERFLARKKAKVEE
ncbi:BnaA04g15740D [Brassica napus]|uniref:BnaA04g15740D protein n=1 Tax=Brassica napus TaxID=3708 RepID=A0A078GZK3_BRANA|nr:BnaA04g15740D [Brassica napus]